MDHYAQCRKCKHETQHILLCEKVTESEHPPQFDYEVSFQMLECMGCHSIAFRRKTYFSEYVSMTDDSYGETTIEDDGMRYEYFPPLDSRVPPVWMSSVPPGFQKLSEEVYRAINNGLYCLATMGARAIIDMMFTDQLGSNEGRFKDRLNELCKNGILGGIQKDILNVALDAGHATTHRGHVPKPMEVAQVMDIIENLLHTVYELKPVAERLKKSIPARQTAKEAP